MQNIIMRKIKKYKIVDLFAGPGGLGEGFATAVDETGKNLFDIVLSIEKDFIAHQTLHLRAFLRKFNTLPPEYCEYIKGNISKEELFELYPTEKKVADSEALKLELGKSDSTDKEISATIKKALGGAKNWILIGGPPCQAYSLIGRARMKNGDVEKFENDERHFLYEKYLKILNEHIPPFFLMENVKGLLSSTVKGEKIFERIISDLENPSKISNYNRENNYTYKIYSFVKKTEDNKKLLPGDYVIRSEEYGIPQSRHRVFLFGVREDISIKQMILRKNNKKISISEIIGDLPKLRSGLSREFDSPEKWKNIFSRLENLKWVGCLDHELKEKIKQSLKKIQKSEYGRGREYIQYTSTEHKDKLRRFIFSNSTGLCNHNSRSHIRKDLYRYLFASCFAEVYNRSPKLNEFPKDILPSHKNAQNGNTQYFTDRFRVQLRNKPATTITSHISKDGHYYIHPDPEQCRSLTVREAARIQTFPDNYCFEGPRTEQYKQVGNAVPPFLAKQIAQLLYQMAVSGR